MNDDETVFLTPRQRDVLLEIARLEQLHQAITLTRIGTELKMPRQNARTYLLALRDRGLALYEAGPRQTAVIRLTEQGRTLTGTLEQEPGLISFPILGEVAAGEPIPAADQIEGYAARLQDMLDLREGDFLLRVRGDSMIGVGIYSGDLVAIHPTNEEPHSGEITLVTVPGQNTATLKRWQRNNGTVSLFSENPEYGSLTFKVEDVQIQGCLVGHIGTGRSRRNGGNGGD
jgi:repressor LexA